MATKYLMERSTTLGATVIRSVAGSRKPTPTAHMLVLRFGGADARRWGDERRTVSADFQIVFDHGAVAGS